MEESFRCCVAYWPVCLFGEGARTRYDVAEASRMAQNSCWKSPILQRTCGWMDGHRVHFYPVLPEYIFMGVLVGGDNGVPFQPQSLASPFPTAVAHLLDSPMPAIMNRPQNPRSFMHPHHLLAHFPLLVCIDSFRPVNTSSYATSPQGEHSHECVPVMYALLWTCRLDLYH